MISLGIDLSLMATGCIRLGDGKIIDRQLISVKPKGKSHLDELNRLTNIRDQIITTDVKIAVIEGIAYGIIRSRSLSQLSGLNYMVREYLLLRDIPFIIVAPTTLKKFITGKGNCAKDVMLLETYKRYGVSFKDDNLADAYGLARIGEALLNKDIKLTKFQQEVIDLLGVQLILIKHIKE